MHHWTVHFVTNRKKHWIFYGYNALIIDAREVNENVVCKYVFLDPIIVQSLGSQYLPNLSRVISSIQLIKQIFVYLQQKNGSLGSSNECCQKFDPSMSKGIHLRPNEARVEIRIPNCTLFSLLLINC